HTACLAIRHLSCVERIMSKAGSPATEGGLTHEQWLAYADRAIRFSEAADRALKDLGLDRREASSIWEEIKRASVDAQDRSRRDGTGSVGGSQLEEARGDPGTFSAAERPNGSFEDQESGDRAERSGETIPPRGGSLADEESDQ